jgi:hypothetical protein
MRNTPKAKAARAHDAKVDQSMDAERLNILEEAAEQIRRRIKYRIEDQEAREAAA